MSEPGEVAERLIALVDGFGFELLLGYSWTSPERMREQVDAFVCEQLGVAPDALAADARAAAGATELGQ